MSFQVFIPPASFGEQVEPGKAIIGQKGIAKFNGGELRRAGMTSDCVILVDADLCRIAIRQPTSDGLAAPTTKIRWAKNRGSGSVCLSKAIKYLGLDPKKLTVRQEVQFKDNLLILNLGDVQITAKKGASKH